jgi:hypothetical protein
MNHHLSYSSRPLADTPIASRVMFRSNEQGVGDQLGVA